MAKRESKDEDERRRVEVARVRGQIQVGAGQLDVEETIVGEEVFRRWREKHRDLRRESSA